MLTAYRRKGKLPSSAPLAKMIRELAQPAKGKRGSKKTKAVKAVAPAAWTEYEKLAIQNAVSRGKTRLPHHDRDRSALRHADRGPATGPEWAGIVC